MNFIRTVANNPLENKGETQIEWTVITYRIDEEIGYKLREYLQSLINKTLNNIHIREDYCGSTFYLYFAFPFLTEENKKIKINEIEKILNDFSAEIIEAKRLKKLLDNLKS